MTHTTPLYARLAVVGLMALMAVPAAAALPLGLQSPVPIPALPVPVPAMENVTVPTPLGTAYVDSDTGNIGADLALPPLAVPAVAQATVRIHAGLDGVTADGSAAAQADQFSAGADPHASAGPSGVMAKIGAWFKGLF